MKLLDERISDYISEMSTTPSQLAQELGRDTQENHPLGRMVCGDIIASFLGFMIRSHGVKRILEVGTFTGYSALSMAENLPSDGEIITVDKNKRINKYAKSFWEQSPHNTKITAMFGEGVKVIPTLEGKFDLIFIDADKRNYVEYLKLTLPLLSEKGIILVDNVLWSGRVVPGFSPTEDDKSTPYIKAFNDFVANSKDLYSTLVPIRDGLYMIQKYNY